MISTTRTVGAAPQLPISTAGAFPKAEQFDAVWGQICEVADEWQHIDPAAHLEQWCGEVPDGVGAALMKVNHVGLYLGDYTTNEQVWEWADFVRAQRAAHDVEVGPSYISPKQYGTQGWWTSFSLPASGVETFTCLDFGTWRARGVEERYRLMSHVALQVHDLPDVRRVLDAFESHVPNVEVIAFTEADELGHTYGHLRHNTTKVVVEIVHHDPPSTR